MKVELTKLHSETSLRWSHARSWTVLRHFPIYLMPDNDNHVQFYGSSCSSEPPFTDNSVVRVNIVLLFKLKYCTRNQNMWKFSCNVHSRANSIILKCIDGKGATCRLLKELNVGCWDWNCFLVIWYQYLIIFLDVCNAVCWVKYYDHHTKENHFGILCKFGLSVYFNFPCLAKSFVSV
jgi:hypothetical protein